MGRPTPVQTLVLSRPSQFSKPSPEMRRSFVPFVKVFRSCFSSAMAPGECSAFPFHSFDFARLFPAAQICHSFRAQRLTPTKQFAIPVLSLSPARRASARAPSTSSCSKYAVYHPCAIAIPDSRDRDTLTPSPSLSPTRPAARGPASNTASTTTSSRRMRSWS